MENKPGQSQVPQTDTPVIDNLTDELEAIKRRAETDRMNDTKKSSGKINVFLFMIGIILFLVVFFILAYNIVKRNPSIREKFSSINFGKKESQYVIDEKTPVVSTEPADSNNSPILAETENRKSGTPLPVSDMSLFIEKDLLYSFKYPAVSKKANYIESGFEGIQISYLTSGNGFNLKTVYIKGKDMDAKKEAEELQNKAKSYLRRNETISNVSPITIGGKSGFYYKISGDGEARDYFVDINGEVLRIKVIITGDKDSIVKHQLLVDGVIASFNFAPKKDDAITSKGGI